MTLKSALLVILSLTSVTTTCCSKICDLVGIFPTQYSGREVLWLREYNDTISKAISDFNMQEGKSCDGRVQFQRLHIIDSSNDFGALRELLSSDNSNLCGIIGSFFSTDVQYSAIIPMLQQHTDKTSNSLPYISPTSYSNISVSDYPYYFSLAPSIDQSVGAIVEYLEDIGRRYIGIIYDSYEYGQSFLRQFRLSIEGMDFYIQSEDLIGGKNIKESLRSKLMTLKSTGYRTILLVMETDVLISTVAEEANVLDMLEGYFWIFVYENPIFNGKSTGEEYPSNEVLHFLEGSAMFTPGDTDGSGSDIFSSFGYIPTNSIYLKYVYDSVISLGKAQCSFVTSGHNANSSIYDELLQVSFKGMSGIVSFDVTSHRKQVVSYQIRNLFIDEQLNENMVYGYSDMGMLSAEYIDSQWRNWKQHMYRNRITPPVFTDLSRYRRVMSNTIYITSLSIWFFIIFQLILTCAWVYLNNDTNVMKDSKPFAMYLLCFGAFLHSLAGLGATITGTQWMVEREKLNGFFCYAFVWTLYSGYAIEFISYVFFLAPLIKANGDNGIQVNEKQLLSSIIIVVLLGYLTLLTMSFFDPWSLRTVSVNGTNEYGVPNDLRTQCDCREQNNYIYYLASLGLVVVASAIIILRAAVKVRPYDEPYGDGGWMMRCVLSQLYVWLLGVPYIFVIGDISYEVMHLNATLILFLWTLSPLSFLVLPKVAHVREEKAAAAHVVAAIVRVDKSIGSSSYGPEPNMNIDRQLVLKHVEKAIYDRQAGDDQDFPPVSIEAPLPEFVVISKKKTVQGSTHERKEERRNEIGVPTCELINTIEYFIAQDLGSLDLAECASNSYSGSKRIEFNDEREKFLEKVLDEALRNLVDEFDKLSIPGVDCDE